MKNLTLNIRDQDHTFQIEPRKAMYDTHYYIRYQDEFVAVALKEEWIERICTEHVLYGNWTEKVNCRFD